MVAPEAGYGGDTTSLAKCDEAEISNTHCIYIYAFMVSFEKCHLEKKEN